GRWTAAVEKRSRTGLRCCGERPTRSMLEAQLVPDLDVAARTFAGRQLDDHLRTPAAHDPPRRDAVRDVHDAELSVQEHDVDRKAHERRVHGGRRPEEHPIAPGELLP